MVEFVRLGEALRVPRSWVYRAAREGRLPVVELGRYRRFDEVELERWLEARLTASRGGRAL